MSLSHEFCSNLRLSLSEIEAKHAKLVELLVKINETGSAELFNEAQELKHQIEADFEAIPSSNAFKVMEFLKTIEGKYTFYDIDLEAKSSSEYQKQILENGHKFYGEAEYLLETKEFATSLKSEQLKLIKLSVQALGFPNGATFAEISNKAKELGLDLCPPEVGPAYRLQYTDQPMNEYVGIGMMPIAGADGEPRVFDVGRDASGSYLDTYWTEPAGRWNASYLVVFSIRK